jgi:DNA-binding MarR family transcriptional regulator
VSDQFEIQIKSSNRWSLHSYKSSENEAITEARQLLKQRIADEAKVILKKNEDDEGKIVFSEDQSSQKKKAGLGFIKDSPIFNTVDDLLEDQGMQTLATLLRDYCDQLVISPTELFHDARAIEKLTDGSLCTSMLDRLAALQAVKAKENEKDRRDKLYELLEAAKEKARRSGHDDIGEGKLDDYIKNAGSLSDKDVRYRIILSISKATMRSSSWEGKLSVLFDLLGEFEPEKLDEKTVVILDDILCELLSIQTLVLEMLGHQPDRFNAIKVLTELCIARYEPKKWDTPGLTKTAQLMRKLPMTKCRANLADRIEQMLRSRTSLTKGDIFEEKHAFKELLPLFISKSGTILGGEGMAEALTMCGTRSFNRDRNLDNPAEAINYIVENLNAPILQLRFLLTLSKSQFGQDCANVVCDFIPKFMVGPEHVHEIVHYKLPLKRKLKIITGLQKMALEINLPGKMNLKLVEWLDELLFNFLDEERIIDKLDSPEETLFVRATGLLQFCASGTLIEGKTLNWVRQRVQDHLRQPNFVEKFTEGVETTKKKELIITQLHAMLKKAGLQQ